MGKALWCVVVLFALGLGSSPSSSQTLYRWVDEKGVTHYSQDPPAKARSRATKIQTAPAAPDAEAGARPAQTLQQQEEEFQQRRRAREAAAAKETETMQTAGKSKADLAQRCAEARARIESLQGERRSQRVWDENRLITSEKANRAFDRRGIELNELGKFVDENCPPG